MCSVNINGGGGGSSFNSAGLSTVTCSSKTGVLGNVDISGVPGPVESNAHMTS